MAKDWYTIQDVGTLDSPALVIFPERVKANIQLAISMVGDVSRLRPHVKTNKSADAIHLMIAAGINKFKCATIAEAELLGMCGAKDVLLAYQPKGPKLERFIQVIKKYDTTDFGCITDNLSIAKELSKAFAVKGLTIRVYIDLNVGMNRTGIPPGDAAIELYIFLSSAPGIKAAGLHAYDGHVRDVDINARTKICNEAFLQVGEMKDVLEKKGLPVPVIIAGGSPTFPIHAKRKEVECSPGTFIYWDKGYMDVCPEQTFLPAAVLITRIVSLPAGKVCTDLGHKSVAAENEITRRIYFLNTTGLQPVSQSEEHLVLEVSSNHSLKEGDILYGLPWHVCPTIALYERAYTIENGKISGEWRNTARDRKITL
ncbi:MAG: D-TA family PLP-dependent enzyme [Chitinophagaceae bacterium]